MTDNKQTKRYPLTEEIEDLFFEASTAEECKEKAIKNFFTGKRAIYYGKVAKKKKAEAWRKVFKLYPEFEGKQIQTVVGGCDGHEPYAIILE